MFSRDLSGRNRTRTCDPIDVNDVLYQLSHATMRDFYEVTSRYYQLSHATVLLINKRNNITFRWGCQGVFFNYLKFGVPEREGE